jgi:ABC-type Fe3+/spermidine/putrescine transport system ATPase subunit
MSGGQQQRVAVARALSSRLTFCCSTSRCRTSTRGLRRSMREEIRALQQDARRDGGLWSPTINPRRLPVSDTDRGDARSRKSRRSGTPRELYASARQCFRGDVHGGSQSRQRACSGNHFSFDGKIGQPGHR